MCILTGLRQLVLLIRYITRMSMNCLVSSAWMSLTRHGAQCLILSMCLKSSFHNFCYIQILLIH
uniref:Uncharacterized protein n=1 Tax=Triticum urartu TaxID=4572 RepID=A0A8R7QD49_TRIUA